MRRRRLFLIAMETAADLVSAVGFGLVYLMTIAVVKGQIPHEFLESPISIIVGLFMLVGATIIVRLFTQIPICFYIRVKIKNIKHFTIFKSVSINTITYVIGYFIVGPMILILSEGDTSNIPDGRLLSDALYLVSLTFLPLFLGAIAAPVITYYLFGGVFEHPYRTPPINRD